VGDTSEGGYLASMWCVLINQISPCLHGASSASAMSRHRRAWLSKQIVEIDIRERLPGGSLRALELNLRTRSIVSVPSMPCPTS